MESEQKKTNVFPNSRSFNLNGLSHWRMDPLVGTMAHNLELEKTQFKEGMRKILVFTPPEYPQQRHQENPIPCIYRAKERGLRNGCKSKPGKQAVHWQGNPIS